MTTSKRSSPMSGHDDVPEVMAPRGRTGMTPEAASESFTPDQSVLACVDTSRDATRLLAHADAMARAFQIPLTLLRVIGPASETNGPPDPVDWAIRRHEARSTLERLAASTWLTTVPNLALLEGVPGDEICRAARLQKAALVVMGVHCLCGHTSLSANVRKVLERGEGRVLLVPLPESSNEAPKYQRILVPLDGSCWSESALPTAQRLAHATGAELVLVHITTPPDLTSALPFEPEDIDLRQRFVKRDQSIARDYLQRMGDELVDQGLKVRTLALLGVDARSGLDEVMRDDAFNLVVLSAWGHGRTHISDLPYGNVVAYLAGHSPVPVLVTWPSQLQQITSDGGPGSSRTVGSAFEW
ncbi:universal stress protein [Halomonas alkalisoli]|uniref:universal stress protein n=1 Tax=Halomonas alkalisoli TaxID=2907158 RepID=UPI001F3BA1E2|nr:universal stress protein [Halomonas alkalisoli]MCE9683519.1 universal stress protein [Halomonas alkalisoli]